MTGIRAQIDHEIPTRQRHRGRGLPLPPPFIVVLLAALLLVPSGAAVPASRATAAPPSGTVSPKVLATFPLGYNLRDAVVSPDGKRLYVLDSGNVFPEKEPYTAGVHVLDTASRKVVAKINVGLNPVNIVLNRAGTLAYVVNYGSHTVSVIDTRTNAVTRAFPVPVGPTQIVLNAAETLGYLATGSTLDGVVLLDLKTGKILARIPAGGDMYTLAVNAAETLAYTVNVTEGTLTVVDLRARKVKSIIRLGLAYGVTVNPSGTLAYVNGFDAVAVVNVATSKIVATIPLTISPAQRVHLNKAGTLAFAVGGHNGKAPPSGILHVIDVSTNTVVGTAPVPFMASSIAFEPSGLRAYVPGGASEGTVAWLQMPQ